MTAPPVDRVAGAARHADLADPAAVSWSGGFRLHRPERSWPRMPEPGPVELASPPARHEEGGRLAQLLPMLGSLAMVGFVFLVHSIAELVLIGGVVVVMVAGGLATSMFQRRSQRRGFQRTRQRYLAHLENARAKAAEAATVQQHALDTSFPDPSQLRLLAAQGHHLWERRPQDEDFAAIRIGRGPVAALCPVQLMHDQGPLADSEPDLAEAADQLAEDTTELRSAPVVASLRTLGCVAVVGEPERSRALVGAWLAGLATFHAPTELRISGLIPASATPTWDWLKWLPHTRDPEAGEGMGRASRAVTTDAITFGLALESLARVRLAGPLQSETSARPAGSSGRESGPPAAQQAEHVVVLVDGYAPSQSLPALETLMPVAAAANLTVIVLVRQAADVPAVCGARVEWLNADTVRYTESGPGGRIEEAVVPDQIGPEPARQLATTLAPLALMAGEVGADLPDQVRLVELLGADRAGQLKLREAWQPLAALRTGLPADFLAVPIGRRDDGSPLLLDLKESAAGGMGPHGILVGATGSGKSELLRSLTAAIAARHDPALVNMLLIDFKGGAAFAEMAGLPHVAGLVTNLGSDLNLVDRMRLAVSGELARRQEALRLAGNLASIADYQAARLRNPQLPALPYLVIIVDEFGELLAAKPDFLDTFLTVARLGRSLGVHLLLASQRLDEGRIRGLEPHLRYRLCLRTFTAEESRSVLGTTDAFELPPVPGLGYLRVDAGRTRFKAAICSSGRLPAQRRDDGRQGIRTTTLLTPFSLAASSAVEPGQVAGANHEGEVMRRAAADIGALVRAATEMADSRVLVQLAAAAADSWARQIWTPPLPGLVTLGGLEGMAEELDVGAADPGVAVGLVDLPEQQLRRLLRYHPDGAGGNLAIAGAPQSGKSTLLQSVILGLAASASPERLQFYCLDLGGGGLFELAAVPHVGAVIGRGETEAAARMLRDLRAMLDDRATERRTGADAAGWPDVFLVVDNVGQLRQAAPELEAELVELATAGLPFRLHVILSANRWYDVRPQLLDTLGTRWELHLADPTESLAGRHAAAQVPAGLPGRGQTRDGHVFQAALPALSLEPSPGGLAEAVALVRSSASGSRAPAIAVLPLRVTSREVPGLAVTAGSAPPRRDGGFLVGVSEFRNRPVQIDLTRSGSRLLVFGDSGSGRTCLLRRIVTYLQWQPRPGGSDAGALAGPVTLLIADPSRGLIDLADGPAVGGYAASAAAAETMAGELAGQLVPRLPSTSATVAELRTGRVWEGPRYMLVVDDYDLLLGSTGGPFGALADLVAHGADIGFGVILTRRVAGSQRTSFESFGQRLREVTGHALIMSGQRDEGPLMGGVSARPLPPGRGVLVSSRSRAQLVQCCLDEESEAGSAEREPVTSALPVFTRAQP